MDVVFRGSTITTDENSYVFQSYVFRDGVLKRPYPPFSKNLNSVMVVARPDHGWFSRYPPGHSLWLLPGVWLDMPRLMIPVTAALSVLLMMVLAMRMGVPRLCMPLMLCLSPCFVLMHGTLLSHTSGFLAVALMLWAYFTWRRADRVWWAVLAGLAWSWFFLNRTYTALLVAGPFAIDALVVAGRRRERRVVLGTAAFALCAAVGVGIYLLYNNLLTGDPLLPPYLLYQPGEALGFGPRSTYGYSYKDHTLVLGLQGMWTNLVQLDLWIFGLRGSLIGVLVLAMVGWARQTALLLASAVAVWIGYVFFYYKGIGTVGPVYYFEALPFLLLAAALGVKRLARFLQEKTALRRMLACVCVAGVMVGAVSHAYVAGSGLRHRNSYSRRIKDTIDTAPSNALIMFDGIARRPYLAELLFNPQGLHSDPLLADGMRGSNTVLARYFTDRNAFVIRKGAENVLRPVPKAQPVVIDLEVWNMHRRTGRSQLQDDGITATRVAAQSQDGAGYLAFGLRRWLCPGRFRAEFDMTVSDVRREQPVTVDVTADGGRVILGRRDIAGEDRADRFTIDFVSSDYQLVEPRVRFGGSGAIELRHIRIREVVNE